MLAVSSRDSEKRMTYQGGNGSDGKHYWLTPPKLMADLQAEFAFDFDPCPFPKPEEFDGLKAIWGQSNYVNPPFNGPTAWVKKAIKENRKGKRVVFVFPIDKWIFMFLEAGAKVRNMGDIKWHATEDGSQGPGTGRHVAAFILEPPDVPLDTHEEPELPLWGSATGKRDTDQVAGNCSAPPPLAKEVSA